MAEPKSPSQGTTVVRGASLLIILSVASRALTFVANQLLLRYLTPQLLGISTQLEVYYLSVLFFARESLRVAIQRQAPSSSAPLQAASKKDADRAQRAAIQESQSVVNLGYLALALGTVVSLALGVTYLAYADPAAVELPHFVLALRLYGLAAVVELASEPCFVLMQSRLRFGVRAAAESTATFTRCLATFAAAVGASRLGVDLGVLPFAVGQMLYGVVILGVYAWHGGRLASEDGFSMLPRPVSDQIKEKETDERYLWSYFYRPTISLASSMMAQSVVKHILTQGDTFLVSALSTPTAQGVYALANNYGGLLARLVFQPIEESSRSYFSRLLAPTSQAQQGTSEKSKIEESKQDSQNSVGLPPTEAVKKANQDLHTLLKLYLILSSFIIALGPLLAPHLLALVAGRRWTSEGAGDVLATYCYYLPLLAINGVAEAFVASVATEAEVHRQSAWMGFFSLAFGAAGFLFLRVWNMGAIGLVYANSINMVCRIVWSLVFIKNYFRRAGSTFELLSLQPSYMTSILCVAAPHFIRQLSATLPVFGNHTIVTIAKIGASALPFAFVMLYSERRFLLQCLNYARGRNI